MENELHDMIKIGCEEVYTEEANAWFDELREEAFKEMEAEWSQKQAEWDRLFNQIDNAK